MSRFVPALTLCLLAVLCPARPWAAAVGQMAPAFEVVTFGGESYSTDSVKGRSTLLIFWAPWCQVCQRDLPLMREFYLHERPSELRVVSIGFADTRTNVERFVKERAGVFIFPSAYDEDRWVAQSFNINVTPTYVLLDVRGRIVLIHRGGGVLQNPQFRDFLAGIKS
ncbi:hypothetical protein W02_09540 [Nitrospira sp. KM1]|uniref:TlpA family protein disulfide reductase n=1 Tax=Nitrospira sp. KM1 TaxID=1936990 RepID=UPI0013A768DC|nr:TlpA disulfide reductase family protein [Nitrospira sp. KM1]BCA53814.1 hypothetical protein W02_09540 [Nitrospira sp. KM1]